MKGSSSPEEERTCIFYDSHPCHFLEEALRALLRCLGIESEGNTTRSQKKGNKNSQPQTPAATDSITNSPTSTQKTSPDAQHPSSINIAGSLAKRDNNGSRSPEISCGSGPQHN